MGDRNEKQKYREFAKIENVEFGKRRRGLLKKGARNNFSPPLIKFLPDDFVEKSLQIMRRGYF